jgi:hypothetical protein
MDNIKGAHSGKLMQQFLAINGPENRALSANHLVVLMLNLSAALNSMNHVAGGVSECINNSLAGVKP